MHTIHPKFCDISHFYYYLGIEPYTIVFILVSDFVSDLRVMLLQAFMFTWDLKQAMLILLAAVLCWYSQKACILY